MTKAQRPLKQESKRRLPDVYILMRVFFPDIPTDSFLERFKAALESVKKNRDDYARHGGVLKLLINDDTPSANKTHIDKLHSILKELGNDYSIISTDGKGSAYATYNIRKQFLELTKGDSDAIAITLDQDDQLKDEAVRRIAENTRKCGVTISPFKIHDEKKLDITDDGGKRHNRFAKRLASGTILRQDLSSLSSIGWTKAFSRTILERYHNDLTAFLDAERGGVEAFFSEHRAYEDFIDFYALLYSDIQLTGVSYTTHIYVKHRDSITSSPSVEDFRNHRTASLIALIDLCYANQQKPLENGDRKLCRDFEYKLFRFISSKIYQIEHIISKYRSDYIHKGADCYDEFAAQTHEGYFISKLCRLALGELRDDSLQDRDLFHYATGRGNNSKKNFETLFSASHLCSIPEYHFKIDNASPRFVLRKAAAKEKELLCTGPKPKVDAEISALYGNNIPPQKRRLTSLGYIIVGWVVLAVVVVLLLVHLGFNVKEQQTLAAAIISVWLGVFTFLLNERGKVKTMADEEYSMQKLYYSEFIDFTRHLEANLKVMLQIRKQLIETPEINQVESIHFINLKWPESSCLFSDNMAKIISKERVDDFARLRVNLRNINNSGDWLNSLDPSKADIHLDLEWEIARHFGYLLNMYYLENNNFSFASQTELDMFIDENSIKNQLAALFMDYPAKERSEQVDYFLNKYYDDRRMRRSVLIS